MVRSKSRIQKWCGLMQTYVKDSLKKNMIFCSLGLNCPKLGAVITARPHCRLRPCISLSQSKLVRSRLWFLIFWLPPFVKIGGCGESSHTYHYATIFSKAPSLVSQSGNTATAKEKYVSQFSQCWAWCNCNSLHKYHLPSKGMMIFLSIHNQAFCKI